MAKLFENWLTRFWDWVDTRGVIRRLVLGVVISMTFWVSKWATEFAMLALTMDRLSSVTPVVITAIFAPIVALGGYVFKAYLTSRSE